METYFPFLERNEMLRVTAVEDQELQLEVSIGDQIFTEYATDLIVLWDTCQRGEPLNIRYKAFADKLSDKYGVSVSRGTAHLTLEAALAIVTDLKKTHIE